VDVMSEDRGRILVNDGQWDFTPMRISPDDLARLQAREAAVKAISEAFALPPDKVRETVMSIARTAEALSEAMGLRSARESKPETWRDREPLF
jgi:phage portal protein BeeE